MGNGQTKDKLGAVQSKKPLEFRENSFLELKFKIKYKSLKEAENLYLMVMLSEEPLQFKQIEEITDQIVFPFESSDNNLFLMLN